MPDINEAKRMARALRDALAAKSITVTHSQSLELVAQSLAYADWNTFSAQFADAAPASDAAVKLDDAVPILRMFDAEKTKAFYVDLLGFQVDFEHRFEPGLPLFQQVSRGGLRLNLSEHHGDATPGSAVYIYMKGLDAFRAELASRGSGAKIEDGPVAAMRVLKVWDPASNRLIFAERDSGRIAVAAPTRAATG
jgi:catechol 2,3-dioxygenase-like lactoylglutathione lyase family enzyme